ncbi:hypothetical protein SZN_11913 [Streptomyces zinciresistens K42]|uniref:Uncharacterized protein n=1 Tax=Streptomyces zinciresistens K42 TaxID=700597 RepID=G2GA60_9ACTN|nr:hypothetical protein [Streptomyces zinciresistens]EGX59652.1 hypothetical protein SZN_11913 [Streptomyces zinciresistens K42]
MDPISAAVLAALAGGVGGEVGRQAWLALTTMVRRPFQRSAAPEEVEISSGEAELELLAQAPADPLRAQALAVALGMRAALDAEFRTGLAEWRPSAEEAASQAQVHNEISGGTQETVIQGGDFSNLTFHVRGDRPN